MPSIHRTDNYEDILKKNRPDHRDDPFLHRYPPMPLSKRAKIFAPFDALRSLDATQDNSHEQKS